MLDEVAAFELHMTESGAEQFGVKTGRHDDFISAVGLAAWFG
jgi:hypothetical protein